VDKERRLVTYVRFNHNIHVTDDRQTIDGTQCTVFSNNTIQYNNNNNNNNNNNISQ